MRAILFLPWAMPTLIVALAWRWIYEGFAEWADQHDPDRLLQ
jgi:ABC-type sugar transport system permease subunit